MAAPTGRIRFSIQAAAPFRLDLTAWAIRRRPENAIDLWDGHTYRRVLVIGGTATAVSVTQTGRTPRDRVQVVANVLCGAVEARREITAALRHLLGLGVKLERFYRLASADRRLRELAFRFRGLKPPRFPTVFEALVNGIACQQLSLAAGLTLLNRLAAACGARSPGHETPVYAFPTPQGVAALSEPQLRALGFSHNKARALLEAASDIAAGRTDLESTAGLSNSQAITALAELRGVGRWTAEYVLLRGLGRLDVFPGDDIGARNNLSRWLRLRKPLDYDRVISVVERWRPYAGLIYFHLLLRHLEENGRLIA